MMGGTQVLNAYKKHQEQMSAKHLNKQWDHPTPKTKEDFYAKVSKKPKENLEAILKLEDELWNS